MTDGSTVSTSEDEGSTSWQEHLVYLVTRQTKERMRLKSHNPA